MSHGSSPPETSRHGWALYASAVLSVVAFVTGFLGMWQWEVAAHPGVTPNAWSITYETLQLFFLGSPRLDGQIPWLLTLGRYIGVVLFFAGIAKALHAVFRDEWLALRVRLPWTRGHVIVCGLDDLGLRLALDGSRRGTRVVVIDKQVESSVRAQLRKSGVLVINGDPADPVQLARARPERAGFILALSPDDSTNIAIAARVAPFAARRKMANPLVCRLLIARPETRDIVAAHNELLPSDPHYCINLHDLDRRSIAVRQLLNEHPLDFERIDPASDTVVHLVIVGLGPMAQALALHAALIGHYANESRANCRTRLTVIDAAAETRLAQFIARFPNLARVVDCSALNLDPGSPALVDGLAGLASSPRRELLTYAFTNDDVASDLANFRDGAALAGRLGKSPARVVIHQTSRTGFAALLSGAVAHDHLIPFGMIEDVFTWDVVLHEQQDALAGALHQAYLDGERAAGRPTPDFPAWSELREEFRESNRRAADHIPVKLRALGCRDAPVQDGDHRVTQFSRDEQEQLARMEHARWCAERWLEGWTQGPVTDRERRVNRSLVPWAELSPSDKGKDANQIAAIVPALSRIGRGVYR